MKYFLPLVVSFFSLCMSVNALHAQTRTSDYGYYMTMKQGTKTGTGAALKMQAAENKLQSIMKLNSTLDTDTLYTLPVVVHIIHTGDAIGSPDNPTDAQIMAMISSLNDSWRKNGAM